MSLIANQAARVAVKAALLHLLACHVDEDDNAPEVSPTSITASLDFALFESDGSYSVSFDGPGDSLIECGGGSL